MSSCCFVGPLQRLRLFGSFCPCHESEDEFDARDALHSLQSLPVHWCRTAKNDDDEDTVVAQHVVVVDASLSVLDYAHGPVLQITCCDPNRFSHDFVDSRKQNLSETNKSFLQLGESSVLVYWISLDKIGRVDSNDNDIVVTGSDEEKQELLRFRVKGVDNGESPIETVEQLRALLLWDGFRRLDMMDDFRQEQAWLLEKEVLGEATDDEASTG